MSGDFVPMCSSRGCGQRAALLDDDGLPYCRDCDDFRHRSPPLPPLRVRLRAWVLSRRRPGA